jgi:lycopene cyclase-like protein
MDYRSPHLTSQERRQPPTFLYAMDLGDDVYFVEETSLALAPALPFPLLEDRLRRRLAHRGVAVREVQHEEFCLFPMNPPLPDLGQRVVGFGGAAGMVHPASGYLVGSLLRRAPDLAAAIASALARGLRGADLSHGAWQGLWPPALRWKHAFATTSPPSFRCLRSSGTASSPTPSAPPSCWRRWWASTDGPPGMCAGG